MVTSSAVQGGGAKLVIMKIATSTIKYFSRQSSASRVIMTILPSVLGKSSQLYYIKDGGQARMGSDCLFLRDEHRSFQTRTMAIQRAQSDQDMPIRIRANRAVARRPA